MVGSALSTGVWSRRMCPVIPVPPDYCLRTPVLKSVLFQDNYRTYRTHRKLHRWVREVEHNPAFSGSSILCNYGGALGSGGEGVPVGWSLELVY